MAGLMPWDSVVGLLNSAVDRIWPDKTKALEIKAQIDAQAAAGALQEMEAQWDNAKGQIDINKTEGASNSLFVAGWRPFIGWVCGAAFSYAYVLQPLLIYIATLCGKNLHDLPALDIAVMMPVLLGMLGFGAMRSYDKKAGTANGH